MVEELEGWFFDWFVCLTNLEFDKIGRLMSWLTFRSWHLHMSNWPTGRWGVLFDIFDDWLWDLWAALRVGWGRWSSRNAKTCCGAFRWSSQTSWLRLKHLTLCLDIRGYQRMMAENKMGCGWMWHMMPHRCGPLELSAQGIPLHHEALSNSNLRPEDAPKLVIAALQRLQITIAKRSSAGGSVPKSFGRRTTQVRKTWNWHSRRFRSFPSAHGQGQVFFFKSLWCN